jgi:hypothetical protein
MVITTESGTVYDLNNGYCMRNGRFEFRYWWAYCFDFVDGMRVSDVPQPFVESDTDRRFPLQVGKHMFLGGKDGWRISTKILSIKEE